MNLHRSSHLLAALILFQHVFSIHNFQLQYDAPSRDPFWDAFSSLDQKVSSLARQQAQKPVFFQLFQL